MLIVLNNPLLRLHGKPSKQSPYYYRWHYGAQRMVYTAKPYVDCPSEAQQQSRVAFTALRQAVSRQLHDPVLRVLWESRFRKRRSAYRFLHTYVYAQLKKAQRQGRSPESVAEDMRWEHTAQQSLTRLLLASACLRALANPVSCVASSVKTARKPLSSVSFLNLCKEVNAQLLFSDA